MKIKRQKQAKKTISFYKYNFNFREPFQILLDGTFCQAALKNKIQIKEQMPKYLMGEVQLCTTNCVLKELESLGKELYGAKIILQRFQIRNCLHFRNPVPASQCLLSMLDAANPHHYFIASQDRELSTAVKKVPGVPLLYIVLNTIVLDKPSLRSVTHVQAVQLGELVTPEQQQSICKLKEEQGIAQDGAEVDYRCQHNTCGSSGNKSTKNTSFPATMYLILKRHSKRREEVKIVLQAFQKSIWSSSRGGDGFRSWEKTGTVQHRAEGDQCQDVTNNREAACDCHMHSHDEESSCEADSVEMTFVDSSGNCDRHNHRFFLLLTHSSAGGLPLGVLITTLESQTTITAAMELFNIIMPNEKFFGRPAGLCVIMTDDCAALRQSLCTVYPKATLVLCVFHLQVMWRWLWNTYSGVPKQHRAHLLKSFKVLVYAETSTALMGSYTTLMEDHIAVQHPKFLWHLKEVFERREEMEAYYICRLTAAANNRLRVIHKKGEGKGEINSDAIVQEDQSNYTVASSSSTGLFYHVNMAIGCCTCPVGISGGPCKHQSVVASKFGQHESFPRISTPATRKLYYEIATVSEEPLQTVTPVEIDPGTGGGGLSLDTMDCTQSRGYKRPRGYLQTKAQIGDQPTAVARRKTPLGGRRALNTGRPLKAWKKDHGYGKVGPWGGPTNALHTILRECSLFEHGN
ncbi:hypothetical protein SKAU_G00415880 [Synaphobranchus kaupii]|uniref:rRNA-processing protein UTP23 homolog n=1 Tax=Synaphobranchus kaupii TaxID=118154 RepID=A0A9Q1E7F9_SYNKA|nr:hypothetical protein SKAU_G00415880 [Synaphobranchus kaupii]